MTRRARIRLGGLLALAGLAGAARAEAPRHLGAGFLPAPPAAGAVVPELAVATGEAAEFSARFAALVPGASPRLKAEVAGWARGLGSRPFLFWISPALPSLSGVTEALDARPMRYELSARFRQADPAATPEPAAPGAGRRFSLWAVPRALPLLSIRSEYAPAGDAAPVIRRSLGPFRDGALGRSWGDEARRVERPPPARMPQAMIDAVGASPATSGPAPLPLGEPVPVTIVARGASSGGVEKARRTLLRSQVEVDREWRRLHEGLLGAAPPPRLDAPRQVILAAYRGRVPSAGHGVELVGAWKTEGGRAVLVALRGLRPGDSDGWRSRPGVVSGGHPSPYLWLRLDTPPSGRVDVRFE